jgi:histidine ammonia-lyase
VEKCRTRVRQRVPFMPEDRYMAPDIESAVALLRSGVLTALLRDMQGLPDLWCCE